MLDAALPAYARPLRDVTRNTSRLFRSPPMILDHIGFNVRDFALSKAFYVRALAPLGIVILAQGDVWAMMGREGKPQFWFGALGIPQTGVHLAFAATDREQVRLFHEAAVSAGGRDNGAPGLRPQYHANYYGAFVFDPDGNNIEAVHHYGA
jgi:catechol 2,3-dioxygenase-like lactoylglutathione lyase family enzyme